MKKTQAVFRFLSLTILILSISSFALYPGKAKDEFCIKLDPTNYHKVRFNPNWLSVKGVKKIIEKEYGEDKNGEPKRVNIIELNSDGYPTARLLGLQNPKMAIPDSVAISSRSEFFYTVLDSFIVQKERVIRFYDRLGKPTDPDTIVAGQKLINIKSAKYYYDKQNKPVQSFKYDKQGRLIESAINELGTIFKVTYRSDQRIEIEHYSVVRKKTEKSIITLNSEGQIVRSISDSKAIIYEFIYNDLGELVEEKRRHKGKVKSHKIYDYVY